MLVFVERIELVPHSKYPAVVVSFASIEPLIVAVVAAIDVAGEVNGSGLRATVMVVAPETFPSLPTVTLTPGIDTPEDATTYRSPIFAYAVFV
jgi:hypothetical protein